MRRSPLSLALALSSALWLLTGSGAAAPSGPTGKLIEVVVTLPRPPLAVEVGRNRTLAAATRRTHSVAVNAPAAISYLRTLVAGQRTFAARLAGLVPSARVHWRYGVALDGVSVVLPSAELPRLLALPGATVWPTVTYHDLGGTTTVATEAAAAQANAGPTLIGATGLWGANLATAGQDLKIGLVDDGIEQSHPYFDPTGFSYPAGFPKGNTAFTTPKVIVARAFPSPSTHWKNADLPFDPKYSFHATHVAGIAAGDYDTRTGRGDLISGVAPKAYLGNYKALTVPTKGFGLDGNSPEIAKAIDQAVADGMNVINLSIGEPEVEPRRDIVVRALDNAAAAGVVPVVAAGNDFDATGLGSIGSPANAPAVITVAASTVGGDGTRPDVVASFSSAGPTPVSLLPKPDVTAPGVDILSSLPIHAFGLLDGTSMATPHVAGAAALLLQRHPTWSVQQVKSALASTGDPVHPTGGLAEVSTLREGGGRIDLARADQPLLVTNPTSLGWGLVRRGSSTTKQLSTTDAGGGAAPWSVSIVAQSIPRGTTLTPLSITLVAGTSLSLRLTVSRTAKAGDGTGFVVLTRGSDARRVAFWFHVEAPKLVLDPNQTLLTPGVYRGDTAGRASRVSSYRYPERGFAVGVPTRLGGPEQVFQFKLRRRVANFGIAILSRSRRVKVSPRLVADGDENRLVGYTGLPASLNPYQEFARPEPVVAAVLPDPGTYDFVFDTPTGSKPGAFTFRFWVNDTSPPSIHLLNRTAIAGQPLRFAIHDAGSGLDRSSVRVRIDGKPFPFFTYSSGVLSIRTAKLRPRKHSVTVTASDHQESKNMEDVGPVLPNTRVLHAQLTLRR